MTYQKLCIPTPKFVEMVGFNCGQSNIIFLLLVATKTQQKYKRDGHALEHCHHPLEDKGFTLSSLPNKIHHIDI